MYTVSERPDLWERAIDPREVWPEYNLHCEVLGKWWGLLDEEFSEFQFVLYDTDADAVVAQGHTGPLNWDGVDETLPDGIDPAIELIFGEGEAGKPVNTLCALSAEIPRSNRGRGLATQLMAAMRTIAQRHGFEHLIAPVRPSWKERYPVTPIERYVRWRREDGSMFDPWMRVHEKLGARVVAPLPRSMRISGSVADWESWTEMEFPESGDYVFPEGLAPVHIDRAADLGSYWEPNVWMVYPAVS
jgi:GNAT superfamily N-acetyltransferase